MAMLDKDGKAYKFMFRLRLKHWWVEHRRKLTQDYWWNERPLNKIARKRRAEDEDKQLVYEILGEEEYTKTLRLFDDLYTRGLFDEISKRGIKIEPEWIDTTKQEDAIAWIKGASRYPPFSIRAREGMFAAIKKDRSANFERCDQNYCPHPNTDFKFRGCLLRQRRG
jgi:hypothetical protein